MPRRSTWIRHLAPLLLACLTLGGCEDAKPTPDDTKPGADAVAKRDAKRVAKRDDKSETGAATPAAAEPTPPANAAALTAPQDTDDPKLYVRVGPKDGDASFETGLEPPTSGTVGRSFEIAGAQYTVTVKTAGSGDKINWIITWLRGDAKGDRLGGLFVNPAKDVKGDCQNLTDYDRNDGLWFELGVRGTELSASAACKSLGSRR